MSALTRLFVSSFHQRAIDEVNNLSSPVRTKKSPKLTQQVHLEAGLHRGGDVVVGGAAAEHTVHIMPAQ